jgi:uncharacterized protein (UPF0147 family)
MKSIKATLERALVIKKNFLLPFIFNCPFIQTQETLFDKAHEIAHVIFGDTGLDSPLAVRENMQTLIYDCLSASPYQLNLAATLVLKDLEKQLSQLQIEIEELNNENKQVPQKIFYKQFSLQKRIEHFNEHVLAITHNLTLLQKAQGIAHRGYEFITHYIKEFFGYDFQPITAQKLANEILEYIEYEQENILYDYQKLHTFIHRRSKATLPSIIDFWDTLEVQKQLTKRTQLVSPEHVRVQLVELLVSFALQGLVMAGGELAMQWIEDDDRKVFEAYQQKQQKISKDWESFQEQLQQDQKQILTNIINAFKDSQKKLQDEYQQSNVRLREAIVYLNQSINLDQPIKRYLNDPIMWDLYFALSRMYTPRTNQPWYNIFNFYKGTGDWEFNAQTNSFWQNGMTTIPKELLWNIKEGSIFDNDPAIQSIFTEFVPKKLDYSIEIECTLVNVSYPFFVGIMFNRGRWISGNPERIWWYRLAGLYGTQEKTDDPKTRAVNLSFAQQLLDLPKTKGQEEKITSPMEQIIKNKTAAINFALDKTTVDSLDRNPITFVFKITPQKDTVIIELDKKENGSVLQLYSGSVHNLDPYIALFHGIGFMAVGAQAEFKINKPEALVYTDQELKDFQAQMQKVK